MHTLGQLIGRDRARAGEAEELLRGSLEIEERRNSLQGQAQVLTTLAKLLEATGRAADASRMLRQVEDLRKRMQNRAGGRDQRR
jgi:ATP/maltotriose-dependent transcriptional regulator MalT